MTAFQRDIVFSRTAGLIGTEGLEKLKQAHAAVFGLGGVGSYACEALARSGVGRLTLIDSDAVSLSNLNRQLIADLTTVGMPKTEAAARRIRSINPDCRVTEHRLLFLPDTADAIDFRDFDYVIDAIDNVTGKLCIIEKARMAGVPVISAMGTGNKLHPELLRISDLYETSVCPLARVMRSECRKRGIEALKVVWSPEAPKAAAVMPEDAAGTAAGSGAGAEPGPAVPLSKKPVPASIAFVPSVAGLMMAGEVIRTIAGVE